MGCLVKFRNEPYTWMMKKFSDAQVFFSSTDLSSLSQCRYEMMFKWIRAISP
nr:hypothetical protein Iba_chr01fCG7670 [Ipomoea batatas]GMC92341.1 hypothetical protein Iba_chr05aCG10130 [Ipomoea batatas]GMD17515.1 hypothetical protein Iba_chr07dCG4310 [Ipomoea batatas]